MELSCPQFQLLEGELGGWFFLKDPKKIWKEFAAQFSKCFLQLDSVFFHEDSETTNLVGCGNRILEEIPQTAKQP